MDNYKWLKLSNIQIQEIIGDFVKKKRLELNITQENLSKSAGINRTTLWNLENGKKSNLLTLIQVLRSLNSLNTLDNFEYKEQISPIEIAKLLQKKKSKKRAS